MALKGVNNYSFVLLALLQFFNLFDHLYNVFVYVILEVEHLKLYHNCVHF